MRKLGTYKKPKKENGPPNRKAALGGLFSISVSVEEHTSSSANKSLSRSARSLVVGNPNRLSTSASTLRKRSCCVSCSENPTREAMTITDCRMYEARFPEVDDVVMVQVKNIAEMGAYVALLEYNNIEGMILLSELSRRRIRSISSLIKVGRQEPVMVLRVDKEKGYIDLSKRRVSEEDVTVCDDRYNKSKLVHSIMRHVAETMDADLEDLYVHVGWPLYKQYGHAFEAFKQVVSDPDSVLSGLTREVTEVDADGQKVTRTEPAMSEEVKDALIKNIRRRMTPQPLKIRADIELKCFQYDGVLHIKDAMRAAERAGTADCPVKIKLVAPPLYVLTTQTLERELGIEVLNAAVDACQKEIEMHNGKLLVKEAARVVSERDDRLLAETLQKLGDANREVDGDLDSEEDEDTGMGNVDVEGVSGLIE